MHPCIWGYFNALLIDTQSLRINYQRKSTKSLKANETSYVLFVLFDVGSMPFWVFSIGRRKKVFVYLQKKKKASAYMWFSVYPYYLINFGIRFWISMNKKTKINKFSWWHTGCAENETTHTHMPLTMGPYCLRAHMPNICLLSNLLNLWSVWQ